MISAREMRLRVDPGSVDISAPWRNGFGSGPTAAGSLPHADDDLRFDNILSNHDIASAASIVGCAASSGSLLARRRGPRGERSPAESRTR